MPRRISFLSGFLSLSSLLLAVAYFAIHLYFYQRKALSPYTYLGDDYPQKWPLGPLGSVDMYHEDSIHYPLDTAIGTAEWNATLPSGGTVLHLGAEFRPFSLSMFHQLRCLNVVRETLVNLHADDSEWPEAQERMGQTRMQLARHCMNYMRQMVLCRADTSLESVRAPRGHKMTVSEGTRVCQDWSVVYDAAEGNFHDYIRMQGL